MQDKNVFMNVTTWNIVAHLLMILTGTVKYYVKQLVSHG